jgi:hypothetical protein
MNIEELALKEKTRPLPGAREATAPDAYAEILLSPKHFLGSERGRE